MTWKRLFASVAIAAFAATVTTHGQGAAHAPDSMLGTWKLNVAKSKSPYKSGTSVIEAAGDGVKVTADMVGADGTAYHWSWTGKYDGKEVPVEGTTPFGAGATVSLTRVDAHTAKIVGKRNGEVILTQTIVTSPDGKTRTLTTKGKDAKGQPVETVSVYDKQ
jgi:hypothetical protein